MRIPAQQNVRVAGGVTNTMQITVNGKSRECRQGLSIRELLDELAVKKNGIAVEVNRAIVPRSRHASTSLQPGDVVEIVTFVGGG